MKPEEKIYLNALNQIPQLGAKRFKKLLAYFGGAKDAWSAGKVNLISAGIEPGIADIIIKSRPSIDPEKEWQKLEKENINMIALDDKEYPCLLKEIYDPPAILYAKGFFKPEDDYSIGVVGARKCTIYGQQAALEISQNLAQSGITIISGLAKGIDAFAHKAAIENEGRTIAVLGCGLDIIYPWSNKFLAEKIIKEEGGAVISEHPCGTPPLKQHFPARNRIISGLSLGVLVVEAGEKSGSLITAREALNQNREVFAVPGPIYSQGSLGPNNLIKMGAKLVSSAQDILDELNIEPKKSTKARKILPETKEEALFLEILSSEPTHIDRITKNSKLSSSQVNSTLTMMEMKGKIKHLGNNQYVVAR